MMPREDQSTLKPLKSALKGERCDDTMNVEHRRRPRSVRFSKKSHARTFELRLPMNLWYSCSETDKFREELASEVKAWRKGNPYAKLLDNVFGNQNEGMVQRRLNAFTRLPEDDYHRGGERYCCKHNSVERRKNKSSYLEETVAEYKRCVMSDMLEEDITTHVAEFAQKISRAARTFAERLGTADAAAVFLGEKRELADILVVEIVNGLSGGACGGKQNTGTMPRRFSTTLTRTLAPGVKREQRRRSHSLDTTTSNLPNPLSSKPSPTRDPPVTTEKTHYVSKGPAAMNHLVGLTQSQLSAGFIPDYPLPLRSLPLRNRPVVAEHMRWQPKSMHDKRGFAGMA